MENIAAKLKLTSIKTTFHKEEETKSMRTAMEDFIRNYAAELRRLEVDETEEITAKKLSTKFKKLALMTHPDKTGVEDDTEFKNLLNDYNILIDALRKVNKEEEDVEKNDMANFFAENNIAKENTQSYTVLVEKEKSTEWKNELKKMELVTNPNKFLVILFP